MRYQCPSCRTSNAVHEIDCRWHDTDIHQIEKAHTDIVSVLSMGGPKTRPELQDEIHGSWLAIHQAVFERLQRDGWIESTGTHDHDDEEFDGHRLLTTDEYAEQSIVPNYDDLRLIYEHGAVDGCLDNSITALIAYWEWQGFSWEQTRDAALDWLETTGTWKRGSFDESSPEELVDSKKHVHQNSYGWKTAAQEAATVIRRRADQAGDGQGISA